MLDFGVKQTETYFQSLTHCLELLGDNPEIGSAAFCTKAMSFSTQPFNKIV